MTGAPKVPPPAADQAAPFQVKVTGAGAPTASTVAIAPSPSFEEVDMMLNTGELAGEKEKV